MPPKDISAMPVDLRRMFGTYGPQFFDAASGEPIGWGHKVLAYLGDRFTEASDYGDLEYGRQTDQWFLITRWLTPSEAQAKYGEVASLKVGPRGGFKSVTYGSTEFLSKRLDPRKN
jgi:hypothetical protein